MENADIADYFSFESSGGVASGGISWSNGHLVGLSDRLNLFTKYGEVISTHVLPVDLYYDITSDEKHLWITHKKIKEVHSNHDDLILSRFLLPELPSNADVNKDGKVDAKDLLELQKNWNP